MIGYRCIINRTNYQNLTKVKLRRTALFTNLNRMRCFYEAVIQKDLNKASVVYFDGLRRFHSEECPYRSNVVPNSWDVLSKRLSKEFNYNSTEYIVYEPKANMFYPTIIGVNLDEYIYEVMISFYYILE